MSEATTPTGIPITHCGGCGRRHPVTRKHCSTCGSPSLFSHEVHARRTARINYMSHVSDLYDEPHRTSPAVSISVLSYADAVAAAHAVFQAEHGTAPAGGVTSDRNGVIKVEAYGPQYRPAVSVTYHG